MEQTPNCKNCIHCHWDKPWDSWMCDKWKQLLNRGEEALSCHFFKERNGGDNV